MLQAFVSESVKPIIPTVTTFGAGHLYVSQSDKGGLVFGGNIDYYNSYAQRGNLPVWEEVTSELIAIVPQFRPFAAFAFLGRYYGHVDGRITDHYHRPIAGHVSERGLVLWRV